jgi:hypothetical protein
VVALKKELESQKNFFRKQSIDSFCALRACCHVARLLAQESKPFSDVEFLRIYLQHIAQEICPEKETVLNTVNLYRGTVSDATNGRY